MGRGESVFEPEDGHHHDADRLPEHCRDALGTQRLVRVAYQSEDRVAKFSQESQPRGSGSAWTMPARPPSPRSGLSSICRGATPTARAPCPVRWRNTPGTLPCPNRQLPADLNRPTYFGRTIPVERNRIPPSILRPHPVVADDVRATVLLEPSSFRRTNAIGHPLQSRPLLLVRDDDREGMTGRRGARSSHYQKQDGADPAIHAEIRHFSAGGVSHEERTADRAPPDQHLSGCFLMHSPLS